MKTFAWILAAVVATLALAAWVGLFWVSWVASAPHHTTEANRGYLLLCFATLLSFATVGAVALAINVEEQR